VQWQKAKNIVVLFLIAVNIILFFLIQSDTARTRLSSSQEAAIVSVLNREQISLNTDIGRINFSPMRRLTLRPVEINHNEVLAIFFDSAEISHLTRVIDGDRIIYHTPTSDRVLTLRNSAFEFDDYNRGEIIDFTQSTEEILLEARRITDELVERMGHFSDGFALDIKHYRIGDFINAVYRFSYRGIIIQPNEIRFTITQSGIRAVEYRFFEPIGHDGESRVIFAPDEILLRFMTDPIINNLKPVIINSIDIVYDFKEEDLNGDVVYAVPSYRINYSGGARVLAEFLIDAYSNEAR